jgi:alkylation response protein AidB-like acyl-CoA dehydrogenase
MATIERTSTVEEIVAEVEPTLRQYAARAEAERRLAPEAMAALIDAGVIRSQLPRSLGGLELDYLSALRLIEELSYIDSAAGWVSFIASAIAPFAGLLPPRAADEMLADPRAVVVGAWFPPGTAEPVQGGYRVTGQWAFGTGSNHATWFTGQALVTDNGVPRIGPDGQPQPLIVFFPAAEAEVLDNWNTLGMRGTGSNDYRVIDIFVPDHRTWAIGPWQMRNPAFENPFSRLGIWSAAPLQAVVTLGMARAAVDDLIALAGAGKTPSYTQTSIADKPVVQDRVARARATVDAARHYIYGTAQAAWDYVQTHEKLDMEHGLPLALAGSYGIEASAHVADLVHACAGTSAIRDELPFQKYFRDIHTLQQHAFSSAARFESVGKIMLGRESDWGFYYL